MRLIKFIMSEFIFFQDNYFNRVKNKQVLIECRNGFTCNGKLKKFDLGLNIFIENSILTNEKGFFFREIEHLFLRGNLIKYIQIV